jgi:hypothetical protein
MAIDAFPSGRAFGYVAYPPRPRWSADIQRGLPLRGQTGAYPARVVQAPWLNRLQPLAEDVAVVLETSDGTHRIEGETVVSTHDITDPSDWSAEQRALTANWSFSPLQVTGRGVGVQAFLGSPS